MKLLAKCELFRERFYSFWVNRIGTASLYISGNRGFASVAGICFPSAK